MKQDGFTLVEIVISLAIVSIALVLLLGVFNKTILTAAENGVITRAVMLGNETMAAMDMVSLEEAKKDVWHTDIRYPRYDFHSEVNETPFPGVHMVRVVVRYDGKPEFSLDRYLVKR